MDDTLTPRGYGAQVPGRAWSMLTKGKAPSPGASERRLERDFCYALWTMGQDLAGCQRASGSPRTAAATASALALGPKKAPT